MQGLEKGLPTSPPQPLIIPPSGHQERLWGLTILKPVFSLFKYGSLSLSHHPLGPLILYFLAHVSLPQLLLPPTAFPQCILNVAGDFSPDKRGGCPLFIAIVLLALIEHTVRCSSNICHIVKKIDFLYSNILWVWRHLSSGSWKGSCRWHAITEKV
jgi:hypothetical protein